MTPIRAVLLDLDGLALDTEPTYRRAYQGAAREQGFALHDADYLAFLGQTNAACEADLQARFGPGFDRARFRSRWPEIWRAEVEAGRAPLKPGLLELLSALERRGVPRAVASSADRRDVELCLSLHGLGARLDAVICGDEVERGKPAPDLFLAAAAALGAAPETCVVLEDAAAGVAAARAAGMRAVLVPDLAPPTEESRRHSWRVCRDLAAALAELLPHLPPARVWPDSTCSSPS